MEITIYISKNVFWFVAGIVTSIIAKFIWHKFIVPGYIYLVRKMDENHRSRYERISKEVSFEGEYTESPMIDPDEQDERLLRMKKRMKK